MEIKKLVNNQDIGMAKYKGQKKIKKSLIINHHSQVFLTWSVSSEWRSIM